MPQKTASRPSAQRTAQKKGRSASKKSTARLPDASDTSTSVVSVGVGDGATSDNAPVSGAAGDSASGRIAGGLEALGAVAAAAAAHAATIEAAAQAAAAATAAETAAATYAESAGTAGVALSPAKAKKKKAEPVPQWKNDAASPGLASSMTVLINWIVDEGNYEKWKGAEGDSQLVLAGDISQRIKEAQMKVERSPAAIVEKVKALERQFRQASDFRLATGQGILDKAAAEDEESREEALKLAEKSVEEAIMNYLPYYFELAEVMADRISTNPTGSFNTTSGMDPAPSALRSAVASAPREDLVDEVFSVCDSDEDDDASPPAT
ncbi:hypothetical protein OC844_006864 [Tilletia horrida]|nr:hypothetical protein OC844_006864 [Tilletia horrida]